MTNYDAWKLATPEETEEPEPEPEPEPVEEDARAIAEAMSREEAS